MYIGEAWKTTSPHVGKGISLRFRYGIQIPETGKSLLVESGILGIQLKKSAGIRKHGIQKPVLGIRDPQRGIQIIQDCLGFPSHCPKN